jgi:Fe-S-cluster-containing hydrogenase component 2
MIHVPTSCRHCEHPHCMADCPPNALHRAETGEVWIDDTCIGCENCAKACPYGVIRMAEAPAAKPGLLQWLLFGRGPGPGEDKAPKLKGKTAAKADEAAPNSKKAVKCDLCKDIAGGPACVRACPTGAAIRVRPADFLGVAEP